MKGVSISAARIIYAIPFLLFGIFHIFKANDMVSLVPVYIPYRIVWIYLTGIAMLAAGISFILNRYAKIAGILLAVLLLIFIVSIWLPLASSGSQMAVTNLLKDLSLLGGAIMISIISKN